MAEQLESALDTTIGPAHVPAEYILFQLCREFGKLPHELDQMSVADRELFLSFMRAEGAAHEKQAWRAKNG